MCDFCGSGEGRHPEDAVTLTPLTLLLHSKDDRRVQCVTDFMHTIFIDGASYSRTRGDNCASVRNCPLCRRVTDEDHLRALRHSGKARK